MLTYTLNLSLESLYLFQSHLKKKKNEFELELQCTTNLEYSSFQVGCNVEYYWFHIASNVECYLFQVALNVVLSFNSYFPGNYNYVLVSEFPQTHFILSVLKAALTLSRTEMEKKLES